MPKYDAVISASCYMSPAHSIRLIKSVPVIDGSVLTIITCPHIEDAQAISAAVEDVQSDTIILHSSRRERHLCQDLGFVWCLANNYAGRYSAFTDDDIEFTGSKIIEFLDHAPKFSALGFTSNTIHYGIGPFRGQYQIGEYCFNPCWVDGHNIFATWDTNLKCGVMDACPGAFNSSFAEVEYAHRLSLLSGLPTIGCKYYGLHHHSRVDNVEQLRDAVNQQSVVHEGYRLWEKKFGLTMSAGDFNSSAIGWNDIERTLAQPQYAEQYKRHMIFDGLWLDWDEIWRRYSPGISVIFSNQE